MKRKSKEKVSEQKVGKQAKQTSKKGRVSRRKKLSAAEEGKLLKKVREHTKHDEALLAALKDPEFTHPV